MIIWKEVSSLILTPSCLDHCVEKDSEVTFIRPFSGERGAGSITEWGVHLLFTIPGLGCVTTH